MKRFYLFILACCCCLCCLKAQNAAFGHGGKTTGGGNATPTLVDTYDKLKSAVEIHSTFLFTHKFSSRYTQLRQVVKSPTLRKFQNTTFSLHHAENSHHTNEIFYLLTVVLLYGGGEHASY